MRTSTCSLALGALLAGALPTALTAQSGDSAAIGALLSTGDSVAWSPTCATCGERFENGTRWRYAFVAGRDSLAAFVALFPDPDYILLGVSVVNLSRSTILFDPSVVRLYFRERGSDEWKRMRSWTRTEVLSHLQKRYKRERHSEQMLAVLVALGGGYRTTQSRATVMGPSGVATGTGTSVTWQRTDVSAHRARIEQLRGSEAAARAAIHQIVLAEQTLDPGASVMGFVAFAKQKKADGFVAEVRLARSTALLPMPALAPK
jgi:hypothetical protein